MDVEPRTGAGHEPLMALLTPSLRWSLTLLFGAVLAGAVVGLGISQKRLAALAGDAARQPPVVILSVSEAVRAGLDAGQIRVFAERLAERGFLVLDGQAVLAAPAELYLPLSEGIGR
ncbi:hypothetical protein CKO42_24590 [Lamprobacter modestohalophilus]|uniref:Uncharacterized protein n=1 Tax=Lamprobacter modestohalophilus TaxID=1064514 RepID=A0A9X0WDR9_9GAMM|nr:hypothetical protein [Lamprobacter modestohalophilus]MBK1621532.1 hypothetical protein [Lamprobacter modestohalophilus]